MLTARPRAVTINVLERTRGALNPLNLHWAGVGLAAVVNLYLLVHIGLAWRQASSQDETALAQQQVALKTAQIAALPLQGLNAKLKNASSQSDTFSLERLPLNYSEVATELGALVKSDAVHLTRVQYAQNAVDGDAAGQLTQVTMDAGLSGDYRSLVRFINGLERDRVFFLITGISLTGQQTGQVNLRIRIVTYLRGLGSPEEMAAVQIVPTETPAGGAASGGSSSTRALAAGGVR